MVSTLTSPTSDNNSKSAKKKYKKNAMDPVDYETEFKKDPKFKTELCKTYTDTGFCAYGNKCRFAHGKEELFLRLVNHPKYRKSDCLTFHTNGFCNYGARCHFRHNETLLLESIPRSYFEWGLEIYPEAKVKRLKVFEMVTTNHGKGYFEYMNSIRRIISLGSAGRGATNGSVTPFHPQTYSERKSSDSSRRSRSPLNSTLSPEESMMLWNVNRKLNFNDVSNGLPLY